MVRVVEHLILGSRYEDRLAGNLLCQIEDAAVGALIDLVLELELEVLELLVRVDQVASVLSAGFAHARAVDLDRSVLDGPCGRHAGLVVAAPSVERLAVEDDRPAFVFGRGLSLSGGRAVCRRLLVRVRSAGGYRGGQRQATECIHDSFHCLIVN